MIPGSEASECPLVPCKRNYEKVDHSCSEMKYTHRKKIEIEHITAHDEEPITVCSQNKNLTMFSTANGRNLAQISSTSLEKAKAIIDNSIDSSFCSYRENNINTPIKIPFPTSESGISDFSNSSNKVALTPTGLTMKSRILKESNVINFPINCLENSESKITDPDVCGNNNLIKTPVSIAKSNLKSFSIDSGKSINDESPIFMMASGRKAPSYSMNALTKAGIIMNNNIWNTTSTLLYNNDNSLQDRSADGPGLIAVLNDPSVKTRQSLGDNIFAMTSRNDNVSKSSGFSTASGRNLAAVTEESLIRARQTLDDNTSAILTCNDNEIINPRFPIVNGRSLSYISEKSLNKAQKSLRDNTVLVSARNDNVFNNSRFSTAGGHGIAAISNKSLKKAQRILNDDSSQNISLQEKLQSNVAGFNNSKLPVYDSISRFKVKESSWKDSGPRLKNKNTKIFSKHIDDHSHILLPKKRSKSHAQVSSNSSCLNILPFSRTSEYNSINKLFDLSFPLRRIGLKDIVSVYPLNFSLLHLQELGISKDIINMSPQNAISYRFTWSEGQSRENVDYLSVWGPSEALSNLIESGANSNLIDDHWVCNHYRWIVWKIASMIRSFPHEFRGWWNPKKVLDQLRYRYEREINNTHRSALKLIIEGDGTASIPMILCVSDIIKEEVNPITLGEIGTKDKIMYSLELTDMWYKIRADVDQPLQRAISKSKIRIGYKLEICGAKIVGSSVGVPALDVSNSTRLKLSANSTKLAHWDAKLGFRRFRPYATLRSLCPDGGYIFAIDIIILRKYPMIFRETMKDGTIIHRNEQEEEHAKSEHEVWLNNKIQSLINEYEMQHKQKNKCKSKILKKQAIQDMSKVTSGEQLYVMMQDCLEPSKFWQDLSSEQNVWLQNYIQKKEQENIDHMNKWVYGRLEELGYTRKVVPFFKVRVCDYLNTSIIGREAIINVWQPNELLFNTIKEGRRYKVYNITASNKNYLTSSLTLIHLSSMKHSTVWKEAKIDTNNALTFYLSRTVTRLDELQKMELNNEVDIVAYILVVGEPFISGQRFGKPIKIQTLLVIDNSGQLAQIEIKNISSIYADLFKYRAYDPKYGIYMLSTCDDTEIKRLPREEYTRQAKENLENWIKNNYDLVKKCETTAIKLCKPKFNSSINVT